MLPTFVIALREGVEASLIVGIVAAFLGQQGRRDALRWVWIGVGLATALCLAVGIALRLLGQNLPEAQQEGLEASIALVAVGMVTYMIVWMRRHSRAIKRMLEGEVAEALANGSVLALVGMAFFAVLREGFETAVFLLAVFESSSNPGAASLGAILGLVVAAVLGYLLYKGGLRINLSRFFRVTGAVLALVAAGLPELAGRAGLRPRGAADRHARSAAGAHGRRDARLAAVSGAGRPVRALARSLARRSAPASRLCHDCGGHFPVTTPTTGRTAVRELATYRTIG